jgi:N utilization substance protein B
MNPKSHEKTPTQNKGARSLARQFAIQCLYALDVQNGQNLQQLNLIVDRAEKNLFDDDDKSIPTFIPPQTKELTLKWATQAWKHINTIDQAITAFSSNWKLNRIALVDRSILRLAVYQLRFCPDIPPSVIINEAVELAKEFCAAQSPAFINGLLDAIQKSKPGAAIPITTVILPPIEPES